MARHRQTEARIARLDDGLIARVVRGVRYMATGQMDGAWFGPLTPAAPIVTSDESVIGRQLDYPSGFNLRTQPRGEEAISFELLRQFADAYDLLRLVIETRKDDVARLPWTIKSKEGDKKIVHRDLVGFFKLPDREHNWQAWIRMLMEDMLVIDAATLYPRMTKGGKLYSLEPVDGATIKRVLDAFGRTPMPPEPAYQQVLKGVAASQYSRDELIYFPRNPRSHKVYGYSPVEQVILTVQTALRRNMMTLEYYTSGSVPDVFVGVPETWSADQIKQFQTYWDQLLSGDTAERRRARFVPGGLKITPMREPSLKTWFDDWIARVVCYAFSVDISTLVSQVNRATAETQRESAQSSGLAPVKEWIKSLVDSVLIKYFGRDDVEFCWEIEDSTTPSQRADIHKKYVDAKVLHPDEVREEIGRPPLTEAQKEDMKAAAPAQFETPEGGALNGGTNEPGARGTPNEDGEENDGEDASAKEALAKAGKPIIHRRRAYGSKVRIVATELASAFEKHAARFSGHISSRIGKDEFLGGEAIVDEMEFQDYAEDLAGAITKELRDAAIESAEDALLETGIRDGTKVTSSRELAARWAEQRAAEMVRIEGDDSIVDMTRKSLASIISDAIREGLSSSALGKVIAESYAFSRDRAEVIARTEMARADIQGTLRGWRESGVVETKYWFTVGDDRVDPHCRANEEQGYIPMTENFQSGHSGPPEHPNCRCSLLAGLKERNE